MAFNSISQLDRMSFYVYNDYAAVSKVSLSELRECINNYVVVSTDYKVFMRPHYCKPSSQVPTIEMPKVMSEGHSTATPLNPNKKYQ